MNQFDLPLILVLLALSGKGASPANAGSRQGYKLHPGKVWSDDQCQLIKFFVSNNLEDCKQECSAYPDCSAFNYIGSGCVLRDCPLPVPEPDDDAHTNFNGYSFEQDNSADQSASISINNREENTVSHSVLPTTVAPINQLLKVSPSNQPIPVASIIHPFTFDPTIQPISVASTIHPFTFAPIIQPISVASTIHPFTLAPVIQPISVVTTSEPIAVSPVNRTSKFVEDRNREFETVADKGDLSKVNDILVKALHAAAKANHPSVVSSLLNTGIDPNARNKDGMTPLYVASWFGSLPVVQMLIDHDAGIDIQTNNGSTPIMVATWKGNINIVKALLDANANTELANINGETVLHNAAAYNRPNIAKLLLKKTDDTMKKDKWGLTPEALARKKGSHRVEDIIRDFNSTSGTNTHTITYSNHSTSLAIPSSQTSISITEAIISSTHSPPLDIPSSQTTISTLDSQETTAIPSSHSSTVNEFDAQEFWNAAERGNLTVVNESIALGIELNWRNPTQNQSTALHAASNANQTEVVSALLEAGADKDTMDDKGMTPLYLAASSGNTDVVTTLIEYDVDVDIQAKNGLTPLMVATWVGNIDIVKALLGANANISLMNSNNGTALHNAAAHNRPNIATLLLQEGADTSKQDKWGYTPEELANKQKYHQVESIIKNFNSIPNRKLNETSEEI